MVQPFDWHDVAVVDRFHGRCKASRAVPGKSEDFDWLAGSSSWTTRRWVERTGRPMHISAIFGGSPIFGGGGEDCEISYDGSGRARQVGLLGEGDQE